MNLKSLPFLGLLMALHLFSFSQITSTESFDPTTFPPTGWSIKVDIGVNNVWVRQTNGTNPTVVPHSGAGLARFRSRSVAAGTKQILITRQIDYTSRGTSAADLDFWMYRDSLQPANQDSLTVWVNSTDTIDATAVKLGTIVRNRSIAIPDTQAVNGWYHYTYSIPASFTGTTTRFIFEGTGESAVIGQGANIFLDDISFTEFPPICSGTPNSGNIVNPTPLICGGAGSSSLSLSVPITGILGISYAWESGNSSTGPWTATGGNAPTLSIPSITVNTFYRCTVNCSYSGLSYTTPIDSIIISANTPPTVIISPATALYCAGASGTQLVASGAVSYLWSPSASLNSATGDTVYATPSSNTQYIVVGTDSVGCKGSDTVNMTFNAGPTVSISASPNDSVCVGQQVIMNSIPGGGTTGNTYLWSDGKTSRRDTIIVAATASYSVVVTNSAGCSNTDSITITAIDSCIANFGYNYSGSYYQFQDSSVGGQNWLWNFGDGNGSFTQNPIYTYSTPGTYTVTLIVNGICNDDTISKILVVGPEAVTDWTTQGNVSLYPNPANNEISIGIGEDYIDQISICNALGQTVRKYENAGKEKIMTVSVQTLLPGLYMALIHSEGRTIPVKFIKQ